MEEGATAVWGHQSHRGAQLKVTVAGFSPLQKDGGPVCVGLELVV